APIRGFVIGEDDNTTGIDVITINGIDINDSKVDDSVYDLMGRKVSKPAKGIYIKNGKKVIIK
ncbi:MAG: leucine-rich repeat domain-containing protein, partial [Prevotella sp.]|nr:leucine-rich repeat domain-containing protein [Prevotella sp.]